MVSPWPFAVWGIDIIGALPVGKGGVKYVVVAVDYFTKWAEAEPLATITAKKIQALYGGSSFVDMEFHKSWSQITESNLIATSSKTSVLSKAL